MARLSRPVRRLLAVLLLAGLAACAEPFEVPPSPEARWSMPPAPPLPAPLGPFDYDPSPRAIALCYGNLLNNPEEVMAAPVGVLPTGTLSTTLFRVVSMMSTALAPWVVT